MSEIDVHPCPVCGLAFRFRAEVVDHMRADHAPRPRATPLPPAVGPRIAVPIDPTAPSSPAVRLACAVAGSFDPPGSIELIAATPASMTAREVEAYLRSQIAAIRDNGACHVGSHALGGGDPTESLVAHFSTDPPALVCMATRRRSAASEVLLGSVTAAVVRRVCVPVLTCGPGMRTVPDQIRQLIVASDGSEQAIRSLDAALVLARLGGMDVLLTEVLDPSLELPSDVIESAELVRETSSHPGVVGHDVLHGTDVADTLIRHVSDRADAALVIGTHGRSGASRMRFGSVAMELLHRAPVPVLVTNPSYVPAVKSG